ncbi:RNA polymerase sigma factor [Butyrivibrio sp. AE3004]|uniref:RNA polymerase sigma factor n=1 Tax=Butyrivibrio sp. AE3004 TaxID=1506994 RepID=UPI0004947592|nr:sigma-70 family RNA polymerase sigma factor [Butyrivibrio sp. AE3004]
MKHIKNEAGDQMFINRKSAKIRKLVIGLWNDDSECFAQLYNLTVDDTYNYCRHILDNDRDALEAVTEIYSVALKNIIKLKDPALFSAWLRRIAFDVCYEKTVQDSRADLYTLLHPAELLSLSFSERQIFFLHDFSGLSEKEISNALHISKKHVEKILTLARSHMMELRNLQRV